MHNKTSTPMCNSKNGQPISSSTCKKTIDFMQMYALNVSPSWSMQPYCLLAVTRERALVTHTEETPLTAS
uniref:Uncharacterized protein n=1 Tax=Arion vulgaris TaxID=1028688 RepID=A0A0B6ZVM7_9EUPU